MLLWLNGQFVESTEARISVFDAGFQHGVGLFETMSARNGRVFRGAAHLERLIESARALRLSDSLRGGPLLDAVHQTLERNSLDASRVRLTVTGGDLNLLAGSSGGPVDATVLIAAQEPTVYPERFFTEGVVVVIADGRANPLDPLAGYKTLNYWGRIRALQAAAMKDGGEALWFTVSNHLCGGSVSNVFLVRDGRLLTPIARGEEIDGALPSPVLPGITRAAVMEVAGRLGIPTERQMLDIEGLLGADEVFLTNASWQVLPVVGVEREQIGDGEVGSMTLDLRAALLEMMETETAGS